MRNRPFSFSLILVVYLAAYASQSVAQTPNPPPTAAATCADAKGFAEWINCKVYQAVETRINQRGNSKQTETPSISSSSTSLVDQSSASDLIGAALNLAGFSDNPGGTENKSYSFTASLYALTATLQKRDPLSPSYYTANRLARSLSFTLGQEVPDNGSSSPDQRANIYGFKFLVWDKRDASHPANRQKLEPVVAQMRDASVKFNEISLEILKFLTDAIGPGNSASLTARTEFRDRLKDQAGLQNALQRLTGQDIETIDKIIDDRLDTEVKLATTTRAVIEEIRKGAQLSIAGQFKTRRMGSDEYKGQAILDLGLTKRVNGTVNASFIYTNSPMIGADTRGFCASGQLKFQVTPETKLAGREPVYLSVAGEGKWMTGTDPVGKVQGKISIPIVDGISLPVSFTYATRADLINEKEVKGQFGFTFDLAKLAKQFGLK